MKLLNNLLTKYGVQVSVVLLMLLFVGVGITTLSAKSEEVTITGEPVIVDTSKYLSINLNTAESFELEALPKIGPTLATRIVEYRIANGNFKALEDLKQVQGITAKIIDEIKTSVTL